MSLWLLAGPIPVDEVFSGPTQTRRALAWYPGVGLIMRVELTFDAVIALDGQGAKRSRIQGSTYNWWPARQRMTTLASYDLQGPSDAPVWQEYLIEPHAFVMQAAEPEDHSLDDFILYIRNQGRPYVRLKDRRILVEPSTRQIRAYKDGAFVTEGPLVPFLNATVGPGRSETEIFITNNSNSLIFSREAIFYDTLTQQFSSPHMYLPETGDFIGLFYAPEFDVMVSVHGPNASTGSRYLKIWSLQARPELVTVPTRLDGSLKSGQVVTYRAQVTGFFSMPCPDELVDWTVTGAGILLDVQSKTDANGFATARVRYAVGETGTSTVEASVKC